MITRTICCLAICSMVLATARASFGQSPDSNAPVASVEAVQNAVDTNAAPVTAAVAADTNAAVTAVTSAPTGADTNAAVTAADASAPRVAPDPMDSVRETMYGAAESRSQHAARVNRNIFIVSSVILTIFIICRLALLWKITKNRKKLGRENAFDL